MIEDSGVVYWFYRFVSWRWPVPFWGGLPMWVRFRPFGSILLNPPFTVWFPEQASMCWRTMRFRSLRFLCGFEEARFLIPGTKSACRRFLPKSSGTGGLEVGAPGS